MATVVTKTIKPGGGGDYTTLAAWATARAGAKVDTIERAECYEGNAGAVTLGAAWSLDAASAIEIRASEQAKHEGVFSTLKAYISSSDYAISVSSGKASRVRLYDLLLVGGGVGGGVYVSSSLSDVRAYRCIATGSSAVYGFRGTKYCENCLAYGIKFDSGATGFASVSSGGQELVNCTAYDCPKGFSATSSANVTAKNCAAQACTDGFYTNGATFTGTSDYNCSGISGDAPGAHSVTGTVQFKDAANKDFHLAAADTVARGAGVNLTASGITTDIDGETRPETGAWDIGADQYVAPAPTGPWGTPKFGISQPFGAQKFGVTPWM